MSYIADVYVKGYLPPKKRNDLGVGIIHELVSIQKKQQQQIAFGTLPFLISLDILRLCL